MVSLKTIILYLCLFLIATHTSHCQIVWQGLNTNAIWAMNCDFPGDDLSSSLVPGSACSSVCMQTGGCTHFTWTNYQNGTCWMKKNTVVISNAIYKANAVCGYLNVATTSKAPTVSSTFTPNRRISFII